MGTISQGVEAIRGIEHAAKESTCTDQQICSQATSGEGNLLCPLVLHGSPVRADMLK